MFLLPEQEHEILFDYSIINDNPIERVFRDLMTKALKTPLSQGAQQQFRNLLEENPNLLHSSGLTPKKLPDLVENNPVSAKDALLKLMENSIQVAE